MHLGKSAPIAGGLAILFMPRPGRAAVFNYNYDKQTYWGLDVVGLH